MDAAAASNDKTILLLHLRKTFTSFRRDAASNGGAAAANNLDALLPLFSKLTSIYTPDELGVQFKESAAFATALADVLVHEIRRRANNEQTAEAAASIYAFLRPHTPDARGYSLVKAVNFLVNSGQQKIVEALTKVALPGTLIKLFYLFFDLSADEQDADCRQRLYSLLVTLMVSLCSFECVAENLAQNDDLALLFVAAASTCAPPNLMWRDANFTFLCTIISKCGNSSVLKYVHNKNCLSNYLAQIRTQQLAEIETAHLLSNLIDLIRISANTIETRLFIDDMQISNGFEFIAEFCQRASCTQHIESLLVALVNLISAGNQTIQLIAPQPSLSFYPFRLNSECARSTRTARVPEAFQVLVRLFNAPTSADSGENERAALDARILEHVNVVLRMEPMNYFILERQYPLCLFFEHAYDKPLKIQLQLMLLAENIVRDLNYIPCNELTSMNKNLRRAATDTNYKLIDAYLEFFLKLLPINVHIKDAYRELAHLEAFLNLFQTSCNALPALSTENLNIAQRTLDLLVTTTKNNSLNAQFVTELLEMKIVKTLLALDEPPLASLRSTLEALINQLLFNVSEAAPAAFNAPAAAAILHPARERVIQVKVEKWRAPLAFTAPVRCAFSRVRARVDELKRAFNQRVQSEDSPIIVSSAFTLMISVDRNISFVDIAELTKHQKT